MTENEKKSTISHRDFREKLTTSVILEEALHIVDSEGLDALSLRSLGKKLGVSQAAFYRHIADKETLLNGISDLIWHEIFSILGSKISQLSASQVSVSSQKVTWKDVANAYAYSLYEGLHNHPHAVILILTHPMNTTSQFTWSAQALSQIVQLGVKLPSDTLSIINVLSTYVGGFVAAEIVPPVGNESNSGDSAEKTEPDIPALLSGTNSDSKNELLEVLTPLMQNNWSFSQQFEHGLQALLNGWQSKEK